MPSITDPASSPRTPLRSETRRGSLPFLTGPVLRELSCWKELLPRSAPDLSPEAVARWPVYDGPVCPRCGDFLGYRIASHPPIPCAPCASDPPAFDAARSLFPHAGCVRAAILAAKYAGRPFPARAVADRIRSAFRETWSDLIPDGERPAVVPVPVHPWKYFRRGFNLPALIGARLARDLGWPFAPLLLARSRERAPQAGLRLSDRRGNVEGSFRVPRGTRPPERVLLLDDVYTSGATARECARALKTGGTDHIVVVTVVRAVS